MGAVRRVKTKRMSRLVISYTCHLGAKPSLICWVFSRGYDQVHADLASPQHLAKYKATKDPEDLPAMGQHYCVECAKWFETEHNLVAHRKGKNHKRRLRLLREDPHTQRTAETAVGLGVDNGKPEQTSNMELDATEED
jgi:bud site selection protein 20